MSVTSVIARASLCTTNLTNPLLKISLNCFSLRIVIGLFQTNHKLGEDSEDGEAEICSGVQVSDPLLTALWYC